MAKRKSITIDNDIIDVAETATVADVAPAGAKSIMTNTGQLIPRERFSQTPVPAGFETNLTAINKGGAPQPPRTEQLQAVLIDGVVTHVPFGASLGSLVPVNVQSVITSHGELIPRDRFAQVPVPEGFETNLTAINKGFLNE
jgi:hypothetical protein